MNEKEMKAMEVEALLSALKRKDVLAVKAIVASALTRPEIPETQAIPITREEE